MRVAPGPLFLQAGKMLFEEVSEGSVRDEIAAHLKEEMGANTERLYILGPGGTLEHVGKALGIPKTHLGVDIVRGGKLVAKDVGEREILAALSTAKEAAIVVEPDRAARVRPGTRQPPVLPFRTAAGRRGQRPGPPLQAGSDAAAPRRHRGCLAGRGVHRQRVPVRLPRVPRKKAAPDRAGRAQCSLKERGSARTLKGGSQGLSIT